MKLRTYCAVLPNRFATYTFSAHELQQLALNFLATFISRHPPVLVVTVHEVHLHGHFT